MFLLPVSSPNPSPSPPSPSQSASPSSSSASTPPATSPVPSATQMPGTPAEPPSRDGCQKCGDKKARKAKKEKKGGGLFAGLFGLIGGFFKMLFGGKCSKKPKQNSDKN